MCEVRMRKLACSVLERNRKASVHTRVHNGSGTVGTVIMCNVNEVLITTIKKTDVLKK